jgi:hypothetical protein
MTVWPYGLSERHRTGETRQWPSLREAYETPTPSSVTVGR